MSVAEATRFDMLKKPATAAMSQMSRSVKPARRSRSRSPSSTLQGCGGQLDREVEHGALALVQARDAVVHHDLLAEQRIAGHIAAPPRRARSGSSSSGSATTPRPRSSRARAWTGRTAPASGRCTWRRRFRAWPCRRRRRPARSARSRACPGISRNRPAIAGDSLRRRQIERDHRHIVGHRRRPPERRSACAAGCAAGRDLRRRLAALDGARSLWLAGFGCRLAGGFD